MSLQRRTAQALLLLTSIVPALLIAANDPAAPRPNIVLMVSDDLGYHNLGPFGGEEITPHLDRLAREGVKATNFYVTWPACTPSRASLLTGRYPPRHGLYEMIRNDVTNYGHRLDEIEYSLSPEMTLGLDVREVTLGDMLKQAGYYNGVMGKWDSGRARRFLPLQRGFDEFFGFSNTGIDYWTHERYGVPSLFRNNEPVNEEGYLTNLVRREAVSFIRRNGDRPFFLYVPFFAPHGASNLEKSGIRPPKKYLDLYPGRDPKNHRTEYMAAISCMDDAIGEIMATLKELNLDENTLVIFFSDNGGTNSSGPGPLRGKKGDVWEGGVRSPFLARWPGQIPAGRTTDAFLSALEVMPTLATVARTWTPDAKMDGFDMLPILKGEAPSPRKEMFWERRGARAARVGTYKWVDAPYGSGLFDLRTDMGEKHDLTADKPEVAARLEAQFNEWRREMDAAPVRGPFRNH